MLLQGHTTSERFVLLLSCLFPPSLFDNFLLFCLSTACSECSDFISKNIEKGCRTNKDSCHVLGARPEQVTLKNLTFVHSLFPLGHVDMRSLWQLGHGRR
ncbi:uncharacterized protein BDZ83DRAFT_159081 [Colletotrichum acutatum]|uniref:Secreted protein n=1 Tax=Glomerella acutata TaxID=27357 RepID=A0AAD8XQ82_GLOAC|nr:uncharacterized protein BDZ83DRAFT_159081 [Colletotrichum acutatum]KAK1731427.1 hypothetical protein BDZ83DRAFT_159081 [Colletotrichum acutatum]